MLWYAQNNSINYRTCGWGRKKAERITEEEGKQVTANLHNLNFGPGSPSVGVKLQRTFSLFCTCVLFHSLRVAVFFCLPRRSRSIFLVLLRIPLTLLSSAHLLLLLLRRRRGSRREGKKCRLRFPPSAQLSPSPFITLCFISQQRARERATTYQSPFPLSPFHRLMSHPYHLHHPRQHNRLLLLPPLSSPFILCPHEVVAASEALAAAALAVSSSRRSPLPPVSPQPSPSTSADAARWWC